MHPRWPNGSLSLVPNGGLTIYYLARAGDNPSLFIFYYYLLYFIFWFLCSLAHTHWCKTNETITGTGDQAHPAWKAFPPGFRMISGNPFRRTYNPNSVADQAISFAWYSLLLPSYVQNCYSRLFFLFSSLLCSLSNPGGPETHDLSLTKTRFCSGGLRMQVHFPQCWVLPLHSFVHSVANLFSFPFLCPLFLLFFFFFFFFFFW